MEDDPAEWEIEEYYSDEGGGSSRVVNWMLSIGKKMAVTGIVISSAPLVVPPLVFFSAIGVAFSVPLGLVFAGYACTNKLITILLPPVLPLLSRTTDHDHNKYYYCCKLGLGDHTHTHTHTHTDDDDLIVNNVEEANEVENHAGVDDVMNIVIDQLDNDADYLMTNIVDEIENVREQMKDDTFEVDHQGCDDDDDEIRHEADAKLISNKNEDEVRESAAAAAAANVDNVKTNKRPMIIVKEMEIHSQKRLTQGSCCCSKNDEGTNLISDDENKNKFNLLIDDDDDDESRNNQQLLLTATSSISKTTAHAIHNSPKAAAAAANLDDTNTNQNVEVGNEIMKEVPPAADENVDLSPLKPSPLDTKTFNKMPFREEKLDDDDDDEKMWEKILAMRRIVGYNDPSQATCIGELKALYVFTGVEPPASFEDDDDDDDSDLDEVNAKLKFLMAIVGVK